ncbi:MAG: type II toxin-antitoxin system RelE/ParE family toxin [Xanthobacteraceae bacterium]
MKVRYTDTATDEIEEIFAYIAQHDRSAALRVVARVGQTVSLLADFPDIAQMTDEPGVRRMPVGRYPFLIFYTVEGNEIVILHVRHSAREQPGYPQEP